MISRRSCIGLVAFVCALTTLGLGSSASAAPASKLSVASVSSLPASAAGGGTYRVSGRVVNNGTAASAARVRVYLLRFGSKPKVIGAKQVGKVAARHHRRYKVKVKVPSNLKAGSYSIVACSRHGLKSGRAECATASRKLAKGAAANAAPAPNAAQFAQVTDRAGCAGTRTLGDRDFPEVGNGGFDITHYDVDLNYTPGNGVGQNVFNPGTHTVVTATSLQDLCEFSLDFDGLTIGSVTVDGVPATFTRQAPPGGAPPCTSAGCSNLTAQTYPAADGCSQSFRNPNVGVAMNHTGCPNMKLVIVPPTTIPSGQSFDVDIAYTGTPLRHLDADGTEEGWLNTPNGDGVFNVNEPIGAMTWLPSNNHPADKAKFDFNLTVPVGKVALGNGELVSYMDNGDGTMTWHWRMAEQMATYLSTATIGDFFLTESIAENGLQLYNALDKSFTETQVNAANRTIGQEETIVNYLSTIYGTFPFDSHGVIADAAGSIGYVLEVQTKIAFPSSGIGLSTLAHETGHQWFGDSVSLYQWNEIWQNEGFATYTDWNYAAHNGGQTLAARFAGQYTPGTKWAVAPVDVDAGRLFSTFPVYSRGATMLVALQQIMGNSRFYQLTRGWQSIYRHGNGHTTDFIALAKQVSGFSGQNLDKLDTFFQQWLYGRVQPTITGTNFFS